jgi:hypothetical protein
MGPLFFTRKSNVSRVKTKVYIRCQLLLKVIHLKLMSYGITNTRLNHYFKINNRLRQLEYIIAKNHIFNPKISYIISEVIHNFRIYKNEYK